MLCRGRRPREVTDMKKLFVSLLLCVMMVGGGAVVGWNSRDIFSSWEKDLNGIYITGVDDINSAEDYAYKRESDGDWVCINVAYDMKPEVAYKTCVHECSHKAFSEIYAEECEANPIKCMEKLNG